MSAVKTAAEGGRNGGGRGTGIIGGWDVHWWRDGCGNNLLRRPKHEHLCNCILFKYNCK